MASTFYQFYLRIHRNRLYQWLFFRYVCIYIFSILSLHTHANSFVSFSISFVRWRGFNNIYIKKCIFMCLCSVIFIQLHQFCNSCIHLGIDFHKLDYCFSSNFAAILFFFLNGKHKDLVNKDADICAGECFVFRSFNEIKLGWNLCYLDEYACVKKWLL